MSVRAIRGAITVEENREDLILENTRKLLKKIAKKNNLKGHNIINILFTVTPDLTAAFPAKAARELGWVNVPLMCAQEIPVPGALERCIRVMLLVNHDSENVQHIYLKEAQVLRPDL